MKILLVLGGAVAVAAVSVAGYVVLSEPPGQPANVPLQAGGGGGPGVLPGWGPGPASLRWSIQITSGSCPAVNGQGGSMPYFPLSAQPTVNGQPNPLYIPVADGQAYVWDSGEVGIGGGGPASTFAVGMFFRNGGWIAHLTSFPRSFNLFPQATYSPAPPLRYSQTGGWKDTAAGTSGTFLLTITE